MASLTDFFAQPDATMGMADAGLARGLGAVDTGLQQGLLQRQALTRTLPDEINRSAARGSYFSGGHANRIQRDVDDAASQGAIMQYQLQNNMADYARKQLLSSLGVSL